MRFLVCLDVNVAYALQHFLGLVGHDGFDLEKGQEKKNERDEIRKCEKRGKERNNIEENQDKRIEIRQTLTSDTRKW